MSQHAKKKLTASQLQRKPDNILELFQKQKTVPDRSSKTTEPDVDLSALELKEFLEIESRTQKVRGTPNWSAVVAANRYGKPVHSSAAYSPHTRVNLGGSATPDLFKLDHHRESLYEKQTSNIASLPTTGKGSNMKKSLSTKNIHFGQMIEHQGKQADKQFDNLRMSMVLKSEKLASTDATDPRHMEGMSSRRREDTERTPNDTMSSGKNVRYPFM